jgi:hypothetical protein
MQNYHEFQQINYLKINIFLIEKMRMLGKVRSPTDEKLITRTELLLTFDHNKRIFLTVNLFNGDGLRDRSFDRITFFQNSSVVLLKFVSIEKRRSFEFSVTFDVLSNDVLSKFQKNKIPRKKMNLFSSISSLVR